MLSSKIASQSRLATRLVTSRILVARLNTKADDPNKPISPPDPAFGEFQAAGSHPIAPTTEKPIKKHEGRVEQYNPLVAKVPKQGKVSEEALDSISSAPHLTNETSKTTQSEKADNCMKPEGTRGQRP